MNDKNHLPEAARVEALLREARLSPALPPRFHQGVWRRIEDAEAAPMAEGWLDGLVAVMLRPRFALAMATGLLLAGILAGTVDGRQVAKHDAQMNYLVSVAPAFVR